MRNKDQILRDVRDDIRDLTTHEDSPLWVQYRQIEVLIDIRDRLNTMEDLLIPFLDLYKIHLDKTP